MDFMRSFIESYLPANYSKQGYVIDDLIIWVHYLMLVLFVGWGIYFIYTLFRFRASNNPKANYKGVTSHYSTYVEFGIIAVEVALLFGLAIPNWQKLKLDIPKPQEIAVEDSTLEIRDQLMNDFNIEGDIETFFPTDEINYDMQVIHIVAQKFNYNIHYPGPDGKFGARHRHLSVHDPNSGVDASKKGAFIGLDLEDPDSKDDIVLQDLLILEVDKPVLIYLTSVDVIHSFFLPEFRVKQDAIPGQKVSIFFTPTKTTEDFLEELNPDEEFVLWDWMWDPDLYGDGDVFLDFNGDNHIGDGSGPKKYTVNRKEGIEKIYGRDTFQMGCAQLCGEGHATMNKGDLFIVSKEDYQKWYFGQMWVINGAIDEGFDEDW